MYHECTLTIVFQNFSLLSLSIKWPFFDCRNTSSTELLSHLISFSLINTATFVVLPTLLLLCLTPLSVELQSFVFAEIDD